MRTIRIGSGAGYSGDRIEPAVELAEKGDIQYLVFECLGERTVALAQQARMKNPDGGYDPLLEERMRAVLPTLRRQGRQDRHQYGRGQSRSPRRARPPRSQARLDLSSLKIAAVVGDDVLDACKDGDLCDHGIRRHRSDSSATGYCQPMPISAPSRWRRRSRWRRYRDHRAGVRSRAVSGADDSCLRLGDGRLESAGAGHRRRAFAGMRRPDHRRLLRRSRLQGYSRSGAARLSHRRSRRGRQPRDHQGQRFRRRGDGADLQGATALRGARSQPVHSAGRGRGFLAGEGRGDRQRSRARQRRARHASAPAR